MRPTYETKADLDGEAQIIEMLSSRWSAEFSKLPLQYKLDYAIQRDGCVVAFCELKARKYSMERIDAMGGYMISLAKWMAANDLNSITSAPFILIVKTTEGVWHYKVEDFQQPNIVIAGRNDRNDWQDVEPCVLIDCDKFKFIGEA